MPETVLVLVSVCVWVVGLGRRRWFSGGYGQQREAMVSKGRRFGLAILSVVRMAAGGRALLRVFFGFVLFWGHTQQHIGFTPVSELKN